MSSQIILFDIGGVLIDYSSVFETASKELGISKDFLDTTFDKYDDEVTLGDISVQELYKRCIKDNGLSCDPNYDFLSSWVNDFKRIDSSFNILTELSKTHGICLFSNIYKDMVPLMMERNIIPKLSYQEMFLSCDVRMRKPNPEIYRYVLDTLRVEDDNVLFIDDRDDFLSPAKELGWKTVRFDTSNPNAAAEYVRSHVRY